MKLIMKVFRNLLNSFAYVFGVEINGELDQNKII